GNDERTISGNRTSWNHVWIKKFRQFNRRISKCTKLYCGRSSKYGKNSINAEIRIGCYGAKCSSYYLLSGDGEKTLAKENDSYHREHQFILNPEPKQAE